MSFTAEQLSETDSNEARIRTIAMSVIQIIDQELKKNKNEKKLVYRMPHDLQHYNSAFSGVSKSAAKVIRVGVILKILENLESRNFVAKFKVDENCHTTLFYIDWSKYMNINNDKEFDETLDKLTKYAIV